MMSRPSPARDGQPERGHLLAIANQQDIADELSLREPERQLLNQL